jgi:hypothetical protein
MAAKYTPLGQWLREAFTPDPERGHCVAIGILYNKPGGGTREVKTVRLGGKTWDISQLADLIQGTVETYAQDYGGINSFEIQCFYGKEGTKGELGAHHTITVMDGELQQGGRGRGVKETNDGPGLVAQAMRHVERSYELLVNLVQTGAVTNLQREQAMAAREESLRKEVNDAYGIVREMMMKEAEKSHQQKMAEMAFADSSKFKKQLMEYLPALVNTASGKEIFPQATADTALIEALATSVPPEAIQQLAGMGLVKAEIMGPLMARFADVLRKKQAEEEALKQLPPTSADPREDATGGGTHLQ